MVTNYDDNYECVCQDREEAEEIARLLKCEVVELKLRTLADLQHEYSIAQTYCADTRVPIHESPLEDDYWGFDIKHPECEWMWRNFARPGQFPNDWEQPVYGRLIVRGTNKYKVYDMFDAVWKDINENPNEYKQSTDWKTL